MNTVSRLSVTLTVDELADLVRTQVRLELAQCAIESAREVLMLKEVAELLGRHPKVVATLVRDKGLPAHYISDREPRFKRAEVLAWLDTLPSQSKAVGTEGEGANG